MASSFSQSNKGISLRSATSLVKIIFLSLVDLGEDIQLLPLGNYGMPEHLRVTIGREAEVGRLLTVLEQII